MVLGISSLSAREAAFAPGSVAAKADGGAGVDSDATVDAETQDEEDEDAGVAATQVIHEEEPADEEEEEVEEEAPRRVGEEKESAKEEKEATAKVEAKESPTKSDGGQELSAKERFEKEFGAIWDLLEKSGWQVAQGPNTLFCAMPGVQFFSFKPNINVFDSKDKACWKFIAQLRASDADDEAQTLVWETLWPICQKRFGWFTMDYGAETLFVMPGTNFMDFKPNETIFQSKKGAVLKCLATEVGVIKLGDSVEGAQVIMFEEPKPKPAKKKAKKVAPVVAGNEASFKTPSPKVHKKSLLPPSSGKSKFVTPPTRHSAVPAKSSSGSKKKTATTKKAKSLVKRKGVAAVPQKDIFVFNPPEFRCTFGHILGMLEKEGYHYHPGKFEYDYFAPDYNKDNAKLNGNYWQSQAEFESFLKDSGKWDDIEYSLKNVHNEMVEELREEAYQKHLKQLELNAEKKRRLAALAPARSEASAGQVEQVVTAKPAAKKVRKQSAPKRKAPAKIVIPAKTAFHEEAASSRVDITEGKIVKKLLTKGWTYRPGRFEYDYFKPGITSKKTARVGEDYFESLADLEFHLKMTGLWDRLAREIEDDHFAEQEKKAIEMSQEQSQPLDEETKESESLSRPQPQSLVSSHSHSHSPSVPAPSHSQSSPAVPKFTHLKRKASPPPLSSSPSVKKARSPSAIKKSDVQALTNEIWANSHEFEFDD